MKVVAIVQARMGSTRLPGKVLLPILGKPMLQIIIERVRSASSVDQVIIATSSHRMDDAIAALVEKLNHVGLYRGSEEDVLGRYYEAARTVAADIILRVTADNPFFHAQTAERLIALLQQGHDYVANNLCRTYPYGIDLEAFWFATLEKANDGAEMPHQRQHVTPYIRENPELFRMGSLERENDLSEFRLTVDTKADYEQALNIFEALGESVDFEDAVGWLRSNSL